MSRSAIITKEIFQFRGFDCFATYEDCEGTPCAYGRTRQEAIRDLLINFPREGDCEACEDCDGHGQILGIECANCEGSGIHPEDVPFLNRGTITKVQGA